MLGHRFRAPVSILLVLLAAARFAPTLWAETFVRGDADMTGRLELTDPIRILGALFLGTADSTCFDASDANDSGFIDVSDSIYLLSYLFLGGPQPPAPFPEAGIDPTADEIGCAKSLDVIHRWNQIAIDASGLDHTPVKEGETRVFGEQLGPCRASRVMAIVHIAMFEAVNAIHGRATSYVGLPRAQGDVSLDAAVAQAARDTLATLFPSQAASFEARLAAELTHIADGAAKTAGVDLGKAAASAILQLRQGDGSAHPEPRVGIDFITSNEPGKWRQDPISQHPLALGARWAEVKPFSLLSASQFRLPPPPALDSPEYAAAYAEVQTLGGDGTTTPTTRTADQKEMGIFWAYDGTPSLCAPPRLYNQIAVQIADQQGTDLVDLSRLLALVNLAMADAGIALWESKYFYQYWRPVTGIRESDPGTGPTGQGDGNPATQGDSTYSPLGAPASNLAGPNFTPPFPAYPSGHAGFGGALFETLRQYYGTDALPFTFISDEMNGMTKDPSGVERPLTARHFNTLSEAEEENGQSRIYLGIHWTFDKTGGIALGRQVADQVFSSVMRPAE